MTRASARTLLPLDRMFQILGANPLHTSQITSIYMPHTVCSNVWLQHSWQGAQSVGREDVAQAIQEAERQMADYLGFTLLPDWVVDERIQTVQPANLALLNAGGLDIGGFRQSVQLRRGQFVSGGIEAKTLLGAGRPVVYSDVDGDGYKETATATVTTTVTDPAEIAVYYTGEAGADAWEVRPLRRVVITAGVATITMYRQQLVDPELLEAFAPEAVDGDVDANFLTTVDVYRHWVDPQQQVQLMWSPQPYGCDCGDGSCEVCGASTQYGCLLGRNYRQGIVHYQPATWDADEAAFTSAAYAGWRNPDRLRLWYYAGLQDTRQTYPTLQMDPSMERAVAYYALTLLDRDLCACNNLEALTKKWREELNLSLSDGAGSSSYQLGQQVLDNPFGTTRGALFAWQAVNRSGVKLGRAVKL